MNDISIIIALVAGVVSFLSPCVLPIVPGFLAYLAGVSLKSRDDEHAKQFSIFLNSFFFVLGFSTIFATLGVLLNTLLVSIAYDVQTWLARIGGTVVIFFSLYLMGLINIPFLNMDHKFRVTQTFRSHYLTSFVFGSAFAVGWTPCVGAALGAILGLAATQPSIAFYLLFAYSLGLGAPFLIVGLFTSQATALINRYAGVLTYINAIFGFILIVLGIFVFTQNLSLIANFSFLNNFLLK